MAEIKIGDQVKILNRGGLTIAGRSHNTTHHGLDIGSVAVVQRVPSGKDANYVLCGSAGILKSLEQYVHPTSFKLIEQYKVGDMVKIMSSGGGYHKLKVGSIATIVSGVSGSNYPLLGVNDENGMIQQYVSPEWFELFKGERIMIHGIDPIDPPKSVSSKKLEIEVGDTVKISTHSSYYVAGNKGTGNNPSDTKGTVTGIDNTMSSYDVCVDWSNGTHNTYYKKDLVILKKAWHDKV